MAGLRNKLAHEYAKVDPEEIDRVVTEDYRDLIEFSRAVTNYLQGNP